MKVSTSKALIILGVGAACIYAYNQLPDDEKMAIKEKGKKIIDDIVSPLLASGLGFLEDPQSPKNTQKV